MATFRQEVQEVVDAWQAEGLTFSEKTHRLLRESFDVIGMSINLADDPETQASARLELEQAATAIVDKILRDRPIARRIASASIPWIIDPVLDYVLGYTGTAEEFIDNEVLPRLAQWEITIHEARSDLAG